MKKKKVLKFSKETVTRLDNNSQKSINGGKLMWTGGCTDGCGTTKTWLNCTDGTCTADCETRINCSPTSGVDKTTCTFIG